MRLPNIKNKRYRQSRPFRHIRTPFDPRTGKYFPLMGEDYDDEGLAALNQFLKIFVVIDTFPNSLKCLSKTTGEAIMIAKPWLFRYDIFNGNTINEIAYVYQSANIRTATINDDSGDTIVETQRLTPDYIRGEDIIATPAEIPLTDGTCYWIDINSGGRCWAVENVMRL